MALEITVFVGILAYYDIFSKLIIDIIITKSTCSFTIYDSVCLSFAFLSLPLPVAECDIGLGLLCGPRFGNKRA